MTADTDHKERKQFSLNVLPQDLWLTTREGETIWEALRNAKVNIGECGGLGECGKCKVKVISAIGPITNEEKQFLTNTEIEEGIRLACRTTINRDLVVYLSEPESEAEFSQILITGSRPVFNLDPLLDQKIITLTSKVTEESSSFDSIKNTLGPAYINLRASLHCLRALPNMLRRTHFRGAAVLHDNQLITWQGLEQIPTLYGLSFDIGTTTLVGKLINLVDGTEVAVVSRLNDQSKYGTDVISRLQYVMEHEEGLENLSQILVDNLNHITRRLLKTANAEVDDVFIAVVAGNTSMQHLLLKMDPSGIAEAPFTPVATEGLIVRAPDVGLQLNPEAVVYVMPVKSGYIGGDLMSVITASGAAEQKDKIILGMDFGTNGEIFLGNGERMMTCSAAAGPALEGGRISCGMIAAAGAIEAVSFEAGELHYEVVGNIRPKGICGSGVVELVAVLLELGIIDSEGLIRPPQIEIAEKLRSRVVSNGDGVNDFVVSFAEESFTGRPVYLRQKDIRELQLAKGAIAAGTKILMDQMGIGPRDIGKVYLAGALGNYVNPDSAMRIGLVPVVDAATLSSLGNAASTGASMVLLSKHQWQMANKLVHFLEHVELSSRMDFNEHFVEQIDFPEGKIMDVYLGEIEGELLDRIGVSEVMTSEFPTVSPSMTLEEFRGQLETTNHHGFPVVDEEGRLMGCVTLADLESSVYAGNTDLTVEDIATPNPLVAYPHQSLHEVLQASEKDYGRIPVVDPQDHTRLLGILRRHDILQAYRAKAAKTSKTSVGS